MHGRALQAILEQKQPTWVSVFASTRMTSLVTEKMREYAERLLADEAAAAAPSQASRPVAIRVCEKLGRPLTTLAGSAGFQSLLLRALTLAKREASGLGAIQVNSDGALHGDIEPHLHSHDAEGGVLLVAHLLGLLTTFIGESLTLGLVHDVWPDTSLDRLTAERTGEHEPQK